MSSVPTDPIASALISRPKRKATRHPVENAVTKACRAGSRSPALAHAPPFLSRKVNPSEPKRATAQCCYCARSVSDCVRIRCCECPDELDLCVECFSVGAQVGGHRAWHSYRVVDSLAFPFLTWDWSGEEELTLLEGLEAFGLANWTEVAEHVGSKSKTQCHAHYCERYATPLPDLSTLIGKEGATALAAAQEAAALEVAQAQGGGVAAAPELSSLGTTLPAPALSQGAQAALALAARGIAEECARQALLLSFARPGDPRLEGNSSEVTGFNAKRAEFETEYDNEAELPLADLDFRREDSEEERALKLRMVTVYNGRLEERARRRNFILDRGLLNVRRTAAAERRRTGEEREVVGRARLLARFHSPQQHEALLEGLAGEARLRARVEELKEWRRAGLTALGEAEAYEAEKRRRLVERQRLRLLESQAQAEAAVASAQAAGKAGNARAIRLLGREPQPHHPPPAQAPATVALSAPSKLPDAGAAVPRELARLAVEGKPGSAASLLAAATGGAGRRPRGASLDLAGLPGLELLSPRERDLCASTQLVPVHFLAVKAALLSAFLKDGALSRAQARALFRADAGRVGAVYDLLLATGLLSDEQAGGA